MTSKVAFTLSGAFAGVKQTLPIALSGFAYVAVFGMLARQSGLSLLEAVLMSGMVFAGGAQLMVLEMWRAPLPIASIILTTLIVNLRHLLMGASLRPWFEKLPAPKTYGLAFFIADESWALTMREFMAGRADAGFLLGSGLTLFATGLISTAAGAWAGAFIQDPAQLGLDFAFTAVFAALLMGMWKGKSSLAPWSVAATAALVAAHFLPDKWYIVIGGLAGSFVGAMKDA